MTEDPDDFEASTEETLIYVIGAVVALPIAVAALSSRAAVDAGPTIAIGILLLALCGLVITRRHRREPIPRATARLR